MSERQSMSERQPWLSLLVLLCVVAAPGLVPVVSAQDRDVVPDEEVVETTDEEEFEDIEEILDDDEEDFAGRGITYDPGDRRDPFRSLLSTDPSERSSGPRPEGIAGLMITEVEITGVFVTPDGPVAQVQTADSTKSYLLRVGDQMFDGDVVSIDREEVVFKQIINDPTALKPFREVVKKLNL